MKKSIPIFTALLMYTSYFPNIALAQAATQDITNTILEKDSLFWKAYNTCDIERMAQFLTDDLEFYHDRGGLTLGLSSLTAVIKKNLCSNENFKLRREVVNGSLKVFPLQNDNVTYGVILSGEHVFYILEKGKPDRLDGLAKFTHVWMFTNNTWKMSRMLSYDHGPARR